MYCQTSRYQPLDGCYLRAPNFYQTQCLFENRDDCTLDSRKFALGLRNSRVRQLEIRRRQCCVPTILFWVGTRHCRILYHSFKPDAPILFWVGTRHCRILYHSFKPDAPILFWVGTRHCRILYHFYPTAKEGEELLRKLSNSRFTVCGTSC
jgi:hypothetical protein